MDSFKVVPITAVPSLTPAESKFTIDKSKFTIKTEQVYKEYCPSCSEYVVPINDRCPNDFCRWSFR